MDEPTEAENEQTFVAYATKVCSDIVILVSDEFHGIRLSEALIGHGQKKTGLPPGLPAQELRRNYCLAR